MWQSTGQKIPKKRGCPAESTVILAPNQSALFPPMNVPAIRPLLEMRGPQLQSLEIVAPITALQVTRGPLDNVLNWAPNLADLKISVDFLTVDLLSVEVNDTATALAHISFVSSAGYEGLIALTDSVVDKSDYLFTTSSMGNGTFDFDTDTQGGSRGGRNCWTRAKGHISPLRKC